MILSSIEGFEYPEPRQCILTQIVLRVPVLSLFSQEGDDERNIIPDQNQSFYFLEDTV